LDTFAERLRYALIANIFAIIPMCLMFIAVSDVRVFLHALINPLHHAEKKIIQIDLHVADSTFQQNFIFAIVSLTASTLVWHQYLNFIWACGIVFAISRMAFWIGYRIDPLYRFPGVTATVTMNLSLVFFVLYCVLVLS
jgi:hypothetical protein